MLVVRDSASGVVLQNGYHIQRGYIHILPHKVTYSVCGSIDSCISCSVCVGLYTP